jgi:hypothetical protein
MNPISLFKKSLIVFLLIILCSSCKQSPNNSDSLNYTNDTLSFEYFVNMVGEKAEIPKYLYQKYFSDSLNKALKEQEDVHQQIVIEGKSVIKHDSIYIVTFESGSGTACEISNIATFKLTGKMICHREFSKCDCNEPYCEGHTFAIVADTILREEINIGGGYVEDDEVRTRDTVIYKEYVIKPNGFILDKPIAQKRVGAITVEFLNKLKAGAELSQFFENNWEFVYHKDHRCDGSTDGVSANLKPEQIDGVIKLQVKNDGNGWACDKKKESSFSMDFSLNKAIANWDRFEVNDSDNGGKNVIIIVGEGMSDFLKIHYDSDGKIVKLEYRSENPG